MAKKKVSEAPLPEIQGFLERRRSFRKPKKKALLPRKRKEIIGGRIGQAVKRRSHRLSRHRVTLRLKKQLKRQDPASTVDFPPVAPSAFLKGVGHKRTLVPNDPLLAKAV